MKIELQKVWWNNAFTIETLKNSGVITIKSPDSRSAGLGSHYDVTIITDKETYVIGDIGEVSWRTDGGLGGFFLTQMLEMNIKATLVEISHLHYEITYKKMPKKLDKIMTALKELPSTKSGLRFNQFKSSSDSKLVVEYYGHEVGGSYVYDYEVAPGYETALSVETNREVKWIGRRSGGMGSDIYEFEVYLNKVIDAKIEKRVVKGKIYHIDGSYAFRTCPGLTWAMMYSIAIKQNTIPVANVTVKDDVVSFGGIEVFKILEPAHERDNSSTNSGRTWFQGSFELYLEENEFEQKYMELYGLNYKCNAHISYPQTSSAYIVRERRGDRESARLGYI